MTTTKKLNNKNYSPLVGPYYISFMKRYDMDQFFNWLAKPMSSEDVDIWYKANNIIPELTELFRDFSLSLVGLVQSTYLGNSHGDFNETKIGMTTEEKQRHFKWCWEKTLENFKKESIEFIFKSEDYEYFEAFFFEVFYEQPDEEIRKEMVKFFKELFNSRRMVSKSDLEMFTDVYKTLERSLKI